MKDVSRGREAPTSDKGWLAGILLSLFVSLLCLVAGELVLRLWFPIGSLVERDDRYLYKYIPGASKLTVPPRGSDAVLIKINSEGRRGKTVSTDGRFRVIVYGDSFIASENSPVEDTFAYRLEQSLSGKLSRPVQVINAGVSGYGPDQESLVMEDDLPKVKPDLIVVALFSGNDFGDLLRNKLYRLDEHNQLIAGHPRLSKDLENDFEKARAQSRFQFVRRLKNLPSAFRSSWIAAKLRNLVHGKSGAQITSTDSISPFSTSEKFVEKSLWLNQEEYRNYIQAHDDVVYNLTVDGYDEDISLHPDAETSRYKVLLMERIMERIQGIASKRSIPVVFLILPTAVDIGKWDIEIDPKLYKDYRPSALTDALEEITRKHQFLYLNLFDTFLKHQGDHLFFRAEYGHWNATGQQLGAAEMAKYILNSKLMAR